jgi:hypothetical protein
MHVHIGCDENMDKKMCYVFDSVVKMGVYNLVQFTNSVVPQQKLARSQYANEYACLPLSIVPKLQDARLQFRSCAPPWPRKYTKGISTPPKQIGGGKPPPLTKKLLGKCIHRFAVLSCASWFVMCVCVCACVLILTDMSDSSSSFPLSSP